MTKNISFNDHLKNISEVSVGLLKEFAGKGKELSAESLAAILIKTPEIKSVSSVFAESKGSTDQDIDTESRLKIIQTQKKELVKQLDDLESHGREADQFYKRALLIFIRLLRAAGNHNLNSELDELKEIVKKESDYKILESAFKKFKDATLRQEVEMPEKEDRSKPYSFFSKLLKSDLPGIDEKKFDANFVYEIKASYQAIVDELKLNLNKKYLNKILRIESGINKSEILDDLNRVKGDILTLINEYISGISMERQKITIFIKGLGQNLLDLEKLIFDSITDTESSYQINNNFRSLLQGSINQLSETSNYSDNIDDLKEAVNKTISTIKTAIDKKKNSDSNDQKSTEKKIKTLKKALKLMQKEIASSQEKARKLAKEAFFDSLTGIFNRRSYDNKISEEMERFRRYGRAFALLVLDVDHFKKVNDKYGHAVGDVCLKEVVRRIKPELRETDMLCRYGGEEFVIILPETESSQARDVGEKLRRLIEKIEFIHEKEKVKITISIGVTEAGQDDNEAGDVFARADKAVYEAKNTGRNRVVVI